MNAFCRKRNFLPLDFQSSNDKLNTGLVEEGASSLKREPGTQRTEHALVHAPATCGRQDGLQEHQDAHQAPENNLFPLVDVTTRQTVAVS